MTREEYVDICKRCTNRQFDSKSGLICSLTNKIADFNKTCTDFELDFKENQKIIQQTIKGKLEDNHEVESVIPTYSTGDFHGNMPTSTNPISIEPKTISSLLPKILIPEIALIIFVLFEYYQADFDIDVLKNYSTIFIFLVGGTIVALGVLNAKFQDLNFELSAFGAMLNKKEFKWDRTYTFLVSRRKKGVHGLFPTKSIVFVNIDGVDLEELNISNLKMPPKDIMNLLEKLKNDAPTMAIKNRAASTLLDR